MTAKIRPWEETWSVRDDTAGEHDVHVEWGPDSHGRILAEERPDYGDSLGRARLAAAAPEMARLLLEKEWSGGDVNYATGSGRMWLPKCLVCGGVKAHPQAGSSGHRKDCRLVAVLRKAGVL